MPGPPMERAGNGRTGAESLVWRAGGGQGRASHQSFGYQAGGRTSEVTATHSGVPRYPHASISSPSSFGLRSEAVRDDASAVPVVPQRLDGGRGGAGAAGTQT